MTENEWIIYLKKYLHQNDEVLATHNEDCAVIRVDDRKYLLLTTDALVENVHFKLQHTDYYSLGVKLASSNLSDIAAMGGKPLWALLTLGSKEPLDYSWLDPLMEGLISTLELYGAKLVGGDTVRSETFFLNLSLIGETPKPILRSGARPGDSIFVSKELGLSSAFLRYIVDTPLEKVPAPVREAHLRPIPQVDLGLALREVANAAIDISDGLLLDLYRICLASNVSAEIELDQIPKSPYANIEEALSGGEDYALLFTVSDDNIEKLKKVSSELNTTVYYIGKIIEHENKLFLIDERGERKPLSPQGYDHFTFPLQPL